MSGDSLSAARDIAAILLLASGAALSVALTIVVVKLFPSIHRSMMNLERATSDAAEAGPVILTILANIKTTTERLSSASSDIADATPILRLLGPAGKAANIAETGLGRLWDFVRRQVGR
jgi:hypothetical protein